MGTNLAQLLTAYWDWQSIVPRMVKFLGKYFCTGRGLKQGDPSSPMILNIMVDLVVRAVLDVVYRPQEDHHVLEWVAGKQNIIFYANDGRIAGRDHVWFQDAMLVMVAIFRRIGLETNLENTKTMVCTPGFIWGKWGGQEYKRRVTGEGAMSW